MEREQGQKFVAVIKAKNRGAVTSQNAKNRGKNRGNRGNVAAKIVKIAALSRQNCRISVLLLAQCEKKQLRTGKTTFLSESEANQN